MINKSLGKLLALLIVFGVFSCDDDESITYSDAGNLEIADPLVRIDNTIIAYEAGKDSTYGYEVTFINGLKDVRTLNAYVVYNDAATGSSSEAKLLKSFDITNDIKQTDANTFTYASLKEGLTVNGAALPESDFDLSIGSNWVITFEGVTSSGDIVSFSNKITVGVLSPYAGLYRVIESAYRRFPDDPDWDWNGATRFIGSVDATTYSYNDAWGYFDWIGASFHFTIDEDNKITVPIITGDGLFSGQRALSCSNETDVADLDHPDILSCDQSNILIPDPDKPTRPDGVHRIVLTYGYYTDGSGARRFYEVLEKIQ